MHESGRVGSPGVVLTALDVRARLAAGVVLGLAALWIALPVVSLNGASLPNLLAHATGAGAAAGAGATAIPVGLSEAMSATVGAKHLGFQVHPSGSGFGASSGRLVSRFSPSAVSVGVGGAAVSFHVPGLPEARPVVSGNRVTYQRGDVTEWYTNGPLGLEQGFTLAEPQADGASVSLQLSGSLTPHLSGQEIDFTAAGGRSVLRYSGLHAFDSTGRALPAHLELDGRTLQLRVDDRGARYPVTVDPLVQVGSKLTPTSPSGNGGFGWSVALSADGKTALVGAPHENEDAGAAWIFTRTGSSWTEQAKLTPSDETGAGLFGSSVALSSDGRSSCCRRSSAGWSCSQRTALSSR